MFKITKKRAMEATGVFAACFLSFGVGSASNPPRTIVHTVTLTHTVTRTVKVPVTRVVTHTVTKVVTKTVKVPVVHTVVKTVIAQPKPTPVPATPQIKSLLDVQDNVDQNTVDFTASGPGFGIGWNVQMTDGSLGSLYFSVTLYSSSGEYLESAASTSSAGQDKNLMRDDCSKGCYLKIASSNATYHVMVFGQPGA